MKKIFSVLLCAFFILGLSACAGDTDPYSSQPPPEVENTKKEQTDSKVQMSKVEALAKLPEDKGPVYQTPGTEKYRNFTIDNVLHTESNGDIHYNVFIPESYDGVTPYALYFTLPGYEGLYFQGVAQNLKSEAFGFEAQKYNNEMIIVAPQLSDWGVKSADQTVALLRYFIASYNIDMTRIYANGYSGGGETMSIVMEKCPELFACYLHCSSQWDGDIEKLAESRTPVYLAVGEDDEYYDSEPTKQAYDTLCGFYRNQGLSSEEINKLVVLDIKDNDYFASKGVSNQHGGGGLFAQDKEIMGWMFEKLNEENYE